MPTGTANNWRFGDKIGPAPDYNNWEMIIVDDCSTSGNNYNSTSPPSTIRASLTFTTTLTAERARYVTSDYAGAREYITGIDDDDEWIPNRLSVFLAHKQQLVTHAFCTLTTTFAGRSLFPTCKLAAVSQIAVFTACFTNAISLAIRSLPGVAFQRVLFDTELKAAQDYDIFLRMVVEYGEPWKVEEATQILHINHGEMQITSSPKKFSDTSTFTASTKTNSTAPAKKYQLFTLYQIRNKRMTGALC